MRKRNLLPMAKKTVQAVIAYSLAAAMAVPAAPALSSAVAVQAAEAESTEVTVPDPIASYDFEGGLKDFSEDPKFEITRSNEIYIQKTAEEVSGSTDKVDANGLVYTGTGDSIKYYKGLISNQPTSAYDDEKGTVLKMGNAVTVPEIKKTQSASISGDTTGTDVLDTVIPVSADAVVQDEYTVYSQMKISNPFAGLADELQEYDELTDLTKENGGLIRYGDKYMPLWQKGVTISYWIKVPANEDGTYKASSALRWELDNQNYYQADDYGKYLTCKKYDLEKAAMTAEEKANANESGVSADSKFYFEYAEQGEYTDADGLTGPVYNKATLGAYYFSNADYKRGFEKTSDGSYVALYHASYYGGFHQLPVEISAEEYKKLTPEEISARNIIQQKFVYDQEGIVRYMELGDSQIRFANVDGEFQIDVDNSAFWVPDNVLGINENKNVKASYGTKHGMHNADVFFMNSWQESSVNIGTGGTYASAYYAAESPVTKVEEKDGKTITTKNGNVNTWQHVTITLQNDWVEFYMNGELVDVRENYSSRGGTTLDQGKSFKRLNKGGGLRYGYGSEKDVGSIFYGNYVCRLFMDWLADEDAVLCIGGAGDYANEYNQATTASEFAIDDLTFYDELLKPEQIKAAYEQSAAKMNPAVDLTADAVKVDVTENTPSIDGAVSNMSDTINGKTVTALKVNENKKASTDTSAKLANPFAGKELQGATIAYWMKQDARSTASEGDAAQATVGVTFMDAAKTVNNPKEPDRGGEASSILYLKTNGVAQYTEGYSSSSVGTILKNTFLFNLSTEDSVKMTEAASSWHYYTMTMTNAGIKLYVDGVEYQNNSAIAAGVRFLDGYYARLTDEADINTRYGAFGGTNNQGATTLMDFLTYADTSLYLGYMPLTGGVNEKTNPAYYAKMTTFDTALNAEQVKDLYEKYSLTDDDNKVTLGDVDGNGSIELADANTALKAALGIITLDGNAKLAADVDKNGSIELADANLILKRALGIISNF